MRQKYIPELLEEILNQLIELCEDVKEMKPEKAVLPMPENIEKRIITEETPKEDADTQSTPKKAKDNGKERAHRGKGTKKESVQHTKVEKS